MIYQVAKTIAKIPLFKRQKRSQNCLKSKDGKKKSIKKVKVKMFVTCGNKKLSNKTQSVVNYIRLNQIL